MYNVFFVPEAQAELDEAYLYYEQQQKGLGRIFVEAIRKTQNRICRFPSAWQPLSINTRRALVSRFPFGIIYTVDEDEIIIIAIAHLHRKPFYWIGRGDVHTEP
jgi:plasmid stabilization system protein ParE